jgi:long-subunit acyl-CoA synthetase (AMP-forming)
LGILLKLPIIRGRIQNKILSGLGLSQVRFAVSGSAPVPAELIEWYRSLGLNLYEGYAMSEDLAYSHLSKPGFAEAGYVGVPLEGVDVKISEEGEILIKSPGKMFGYYKAEDLTKESFTEDGYFKTGDRGERSDNGMLKITGRVKEIFKTSKGKYISPAPIENIINNNIHIELSCVSGLGYPQPYAQVQLAEDIRNNLSDAKKIEITTALKELLDQVNKRVEHHERLQFIVIISDEWTASNGCLTPTMKIRRSSIEDRTKPHLDGWYESKEKLIWA